MCPIVFDVDTDEKFEGDLREEFFWTYKTMLEKWEQVCDVNAKMLQVNTHLKEESTKLIKQVEAKESLFAEEQIKLEKTQKELDATKLMLKKFNTSSDKLDEILVGGRRDPTKRLSYMEKGKAFMKS